MANTPSYFFCGIGGSGMLPLASIVRERGASVAGSDRALDQGRTAAKFEWLKAQGIALFPQDGNGPEEGQTLIASAAIEDTVPDIAAANTLGLPRMTRPELLASLFNAAGAGIGIAGTSGKSTVTAMTGWILDRCGRLPTIVNGAVMKNFAAGDRPFASAIGGGGDAFVAEIDESDGSIALYGPAIAVLNNVSLDHKSMEELRILFGDFLAKAKRVVINADDPECRALAKALPPERVHLFGFGDEADLRASNVEEQPLAIAFDVQEDGGAPVRVDLAVPGRHNAANALAAIGAAGAYGISLAAAADALASFQGLRRRFDKIGSARGITVIDDFGHNPDKVAATLSTLHAFPGRLLVFFQPHGYGPLRQMGDGLVESFVANLLSDDRLILCDPVYFGGTTDRSVGSAEIVAAIADQGCHAEHIPAREACGARLAELAQPGDRIIIMGARDDSLSEFAADVLARL